MELLDPSVGDGGFLHHLAARITPDDSRPPQGGWRLNGIDKDPVAVALARSRVGSSARIVQGDSLAPGFPLPLPEGFDVIVGNPPWGGWDRVLDEDSRRDYRDRFETARGRLEPSALFVEMAARRLRPGGLLAFVLPEYLFLKNYPDLRGLLLQKFRIEEIARWGRVFPGVNLEAWTLVAKRLGPRSRPGTVHCLPDGPSGRALEIPQERFAATRGHVFNIDLGADEAHLLDRLQAEMTPLGDWMEAHEGIHSGNVRKKLFVPPADKTPEESLEPLFFGRDEIRPFHLESSGWRVRYDPAIIDRKRNEYASLGRKAWFKREKLLIRRTGDRVMAAIDHNGLFASNNLFVAFPRPGCPVPIRFIEAYLNSSLATWCFRAFQPRQGRLFAELKLMHLNRLPVPEPGRGVTLCRVLQIARRLRESARCGADSTGDRRLLDEAFFTMAGIDPREQALVL